MKNEKGCPIFSYCDSSVVDAEWDVPGNFIFLWKKRAAEPDGSSSEAHSIWVG